MMNVIPINPVNWKESTVDMGIIQTCYLLTGNSPFQEQYCEKATIFLSGNSLRNSSYLRDQHNSVK